MSEKKTRVMRPADERIREIDIAIEKHKANIATLEAKKERIQNPSPRRGGRPGVGSIIKKAKAKGMTAEQIAEKLGLNI